MPKNERNTGKIELTQEEILIIRKNNKKSIDTTKTLSYNVKAVLMKAECEPSPGKRRQIRMRKV